MRELIIVLPPVFALLVFFIIFGWINYGIIRDDQEREEIFERAFAD